MSALPVVYCLFSSLFFDRSHSYLHTDISLITIILHYSNDSDQTKNKKDVAASCGISAMPTFQAYKNGVKVSDVIGANRDKLLAMIQSL